MSAPLTDAFRHLMLAQRTGVTTRIPGEPWLTNGRRSWRMKPRPRPKPCPWSVPFIYPEDVKYAEEVELLRWANYDPQKKDIGYIIHSFL